MPTIEIYTKDRTSYKSRKYLKKQNFTFVKRSNENSYYTKKVSESEKTKTVRYCRRKGLKYKVIDDAYMRSSNYREEFLTHIQNKKYVICAYCGFPLKKERLTVDHIIPIDKAKRNKSGARILMKLLGISNINDMKNLCCACKRCNSRKRAKMGLWVIRGFIGKSKLLWLFRWIFRILMIGIILYL